MMDAYEIGIQLALQDDVSAGLQVISRGLADVDRAIEATSAKLSHLTNLAQATLGAAAAGMVARPTPASDERTAESRAEGEESSVAPRKMEDTGGVAPLPSDAPVSKAMAEPSAGVVQQVAAPVSPDQSRLTAALQGTSSTPPAQAPVQTQTIAPTFVQVQQPFEPAAPVGSRETMAPVPQTTALQGQSPISASPPPPRVARQVELVQRGASAPVPQDKVFTASVGQATAHSRGSRRNENGAPAPAPMRASEPAVGFTGTVTAPWSGTGTRLLAPRAEAAAERPTAPEARQREQTEGMSGSVMLDGHLVGYWLAEQMAKEASRPPSGTSFFDPRQTPAWTASGAL